MTDATFCNVTPTVGGHLASLALGDLPSALVAIREVVPKTVSGHVTKISTLSAGHSSQFLEVNPAICRHRNAKVLVASSDHISSPTLHLECCVTETALPATPAIRITPIATTTVSTWSSSAESVADGITARGQTHLSELVLYSAMSFLQ
jgi:hypothetical protein